MIEYTTVASGSSPAAFQATAPQIIVCPICGSTELFTRIEPPHVALRRDRGHWLKWLRHTEAARYPKARVSNEPQQTTLKLVPRSDAVGEHCHCAHVQRLLNELEKNNRLLSVVTRALMNNGGRQ